ncbi:MAG TPA: acetyl-CoA acetyltransferase [Stellaceae bacterium]|nr:acetyl-CoA acetyltransferase [Stellaceae bacterium]
MAHPLRGSVAVVGIGLTPFGELPGRTHLEIMGEAIHNALADAGIDKNQVDGIFGSNFADPLGAILYPEYFGLKNIKVMDSTNIGGSSFNNAMQDAAAALHLGLCDVALIAYGSNSRTGGRRGGPGFGRSFDAPYKPRQPVNSYALAAARHMYQYGTTKEQLAQVAVAARQWAQKNPRAFMREKLTVEECLKSRMVVDPFGVRDCCLVTDGGAAMVVVRADRAKDFPNAAVYLLGIGAATTHNDISQMPDLTVTAVAQAAPRAYAMAGVTVEDVDVIEVYDAFTINTILFLEDFGFCRKGEGGPFVAAGNIAPGGKHPLNTNGGGLSCVHPGMYGMFLMIEAVEQLRGVAGERQIEGAEIALCNGNGGYLSSQVTLVFGTQATL